MRLDSALELQSRVFQRIFDFTELPVAGAVSGPPIYVDPFLLELPRPRRFRPHRIAEDLALGVTGRRVEENARIAVLVQNRRQLRSTVIDEIVEMARGEAEVIYIGRQRALWTKERADPLRLGCSISPVTVEYAGTLGCFCRDNQSGATCILSNNHVLADVNRVPERTGIMQAGARDGGEPATDTIAELLRYVPIQFGGLPNAVDAAVAATIEHGREEDRSGIHDCAVPPSRVSTLQPANVTTAVPGMRVFKTGRTTCHTAGTVRAISVNNFLVDVGVGIARFDGQIAIEMDMNPAQPFSRPGDSGSLVVDEEGRPVGLLFAGSSSGGAGNLGVTGVNPISGVMAQLDITLI